MIIPFGRRALVAATMVVAVVGGSVVALHYHSLGLTLSHYDARGHLVVARRIVDSLTPGWQQVGAVWLPLPHLLNLIPVQIDAFYRTGASAVAVSVMSFAVATGAIAWITMTLTGSSPAAVAAAAVFAFNPNVLYLQATPMTEPLLLALTTTAVALLMSWCGADGLPFATSAIVGWVFALACLTRYEAWPVTAAALGAAVWVRWRRGDSLSTAATRVGGIAAYPAVAIVAFAVFSRVVVGEWFVAGGFFVPENKALNAPVMAAAEIWWGTSTLGSSVPVVTGALGAAAIVALAVWSRRHASGMISLALIASAAVPWTAFVRGHPFRIRYMVPLLAMEGIGVGVVIGLFHHAVAFRGKPRTTDAGIARPLAPGFTVASATAALLVVALLAYELKPLDRNAPMVMEAQWDRPNIAARRLVTDCLGAPHPEAKIMASMGSLGHYMQEASAAGFSIRDFLHEGNGDIWLAALEEGPRRFAGWVLIEEKAEGGDMLAERVRQRPHFLDGYSRTCEGAGLALYRRDSQPPSGAQNLTFTVNR